MLTVLLFGLQSAAGPPAPSPDRLRVTPKCDLETSATGEVVVCGRRDGDQYRLKPLPTEFEAPTIPRAALDAGGGVVAAETEQVDVGGFPSQRLMLRYKLRF